MHTITAVLIIPTHPPSTRFAPRCTKGVQSAILAGFIFLAFLSTAAAADSSGYLKGVTITDAQATNKPPTATFTYTQNGDIVTFNASGSSDPDGSITKYKWTFGDGTTSEGVTATYALTTSSNFKVTLTIVDNNNGVALNQQTVVPITEGITDDFSIDTSGNYAVLFGGLKISDGVVHSSGTWTTTYVLCNKELVSNDHIVEADVAYDGVNATSGLMFRADNIYKTGYLAYFSSGKLTLKSYASGSEKWLAQNNGVYPAGNYRLRAEVSGNLFRIYVNDELSLEKTDSTYSSGKYAGFKLYPNGKGDIIFLDNLKGH